MKYERRLATVVVVGGCFNQDADAVGAVSFIYDFLVVFLVLFRGAFDCPFDVVLGHVLRLGRLDDGSQAGVGGRVAPVLGCNRDFLAQAGEGAGHVAPAFEFAGFSIFECSSHFYSVLCLLYSCGGCFSQARLRRCRRGLLSHEPQCEPNAEGKFTCTMLRRSLRSLRSSDRTLLRIPLPPALQPHPDKSQPFLGYWNSQPFTWRLAFPTFCLGLGFIE